MQVKRAVACQQRKTTGRSIEPILGIEWAEGWSISQGTLRILMTNNEKVVEASITNGTLWSPWCPSGSWIKQFQDKYWRPGGVQSVAGDVAVKDTIIAFLFRQSLQGGRLTTYLLVICLLCLVWYSSLQLANFSRVSLTCSRRLISPRQCCGTSNLQLACQCFI